MLCICAYVLIYICFFFNDTATTEIYTLSLHDALPIFETLLSPRFWRAFQLAEEPPALRDRYGMNVFGQSVLLARRLTDRKSTRLNSSHANISYAVFCLKKKKINPFHTFKSFSPSLTQN